jgi:uncharacterized protein (DUF488 family)
MIDEQGEKVIWTIGHSTRSLNEFIAILNSFNIRMVADIRSFPGSKRYPHFNKESLQFSLQKQHINYIHLKDLGGRRKPLAGSVNTRWRNDAFRGYADYMQTNDFASAINNLQIIAGQQPTAYMCSEAVWWRCHRALVSDYLKLKGWKVLHIIDPEKAHEHPFTSVARVINSELRYDNPGLF